MDASTARQMWKRGCREHEIEFGTNYHLVYIDTGHGAAVYLEGYEEYGQKVWNGSKQEMTTKFNQLVQELPISENNVKYERDNAQKLKLYPHN